MGNEAIAERVQELAEQVAIDHGLELVHAEVAGPENKPIVRIFIDKPQGVTHEDCSEVSTHLGTILDVEDFIHASYTLEVSSPGLERGLYKRADYERFAGSNAKLKTRQAINGQRNFRGQLLGVEGDEVPAKEEIGPFVSMGIFRAHARISTEQKGLAYAAYRQLRKLDNRLRKQPQRFADVESWVRQRESEVLNNK